MREGCSLLLVVGSCGQVGLGVGYVIVTVVLTEVDTIGIVGDTSVHLIELRCYCKVLGVAKAHWRLHGWYLDSGV